MNLPPAPDDTPGEIRDLDPASLLEAGLPTEGGARAGVSAEKWPPAPEELAGALPGYEITALLGSGGMSAVYKGTQTSLEREVAVKFLAPKLSADPEFEVRFHREAKAMAQLNHPHIVQVYDYGRTEAGLHYIIMEHVDGGDLEQIVRSGQLDAEGTLKAVAQVCDALQYAHSLGFIHRDIKPANVLANRHGVLKVADFGLAKLLGEEALAEAQAGAGRRGITLSGAALGTPHYAAPEQLDGRGAVDHRADLYSLGIMFYQMLTREMPRGAPTLPSRKIASLDTRLDGVVFKAMASDREERYQTAIALRTDVEWVRTTAPPASEEMKEMSVASPSTPLAKEPKAPRITRSRVATWLMLGLMTLLTAGGLIFLSSLRKMGEDVIAGKGLEKNLTKILDTALESAPTPSQADVVQPYLPHAAPPLALSPPSEFSGSVIARSCGPSGVLPRRGIAAIPEEVARLTNVAMISAGATHAMALTTEGRLHRWGVLKTTFFNASLSSRLPREMSGEQKRVVQMIAGNPDAVLLEDGMVMVQKDDGAVSIVNPETPVAEIGGTSPYLFGLDDQGSIAYLGPDPIPLTLRIPEEVRNLPLRKIHGSQNNALAITKDGDAFLWGVDDNGLSEIDPALKMTFKDDPVVDGHLELNGSLYIIVQKSGRFHILGVNQKWYGAPPARVTDFSGIAQVYHGHWSGLFYCRQIGGLKTWNVIEKGDNRLDYINGILNGARPLAIASPTSFGQYELEPTMLMLVPSDSPILRDRNSAQPDQPAAAISDQAQ